MVFANIPVKGWIIDSDIQSLFYGSHSLSVYEDQHFLRPEEARFEPGESLSCYQLFILFLRKLSCLDYSKQDEKSP